MAYPLIQIGDSLLEGCTNVFVQPLTLTVSIFAAKGAGTGFSGFIDLAVIFFMLGLVGVVASRRNLIIIIISLELILLSLNVFFFTFSIYLDDLIGQLFSLFILTVAGAESSIGLALLVVYHRRVGLISITELSGLRG